MFADACLPCADIGTTVIKVPALAELRLPEGKFGARDYGCGRALVRVGSLANGGCAGLRISRPHGAAHAA